MSGAPFGVDPAADFDDPFAILEACHARIDRMLRILERLPAHVAARGADDEAREAIARVRRYFDLAGPDHHADEEVDLFPAARAAARAADDAVQLDAIAALERDHREMETAWAALRAHLDEVAAGRAAVDAPRLARFVALYRDHVAAEEGTVYAAAKGRIGEPARSGLARAMVERRRAR